MTTLATMPERDVNIDHQDMLMDQGKFNQKDSADYQAWLDYVTRKLKKEDNHGTDFSN